MASEPPRPNIDIGRVIGRGFEALKANFLPFFGFALLLAGLPSFANSYLTVSAVFGSGIDPAVFLTGSYWLTVFGSSFVILLGYTLLQGVLTRSTILQLGGRDPDPGGSAVYGLRLILPIVGISICVGIMLVVGLIFLIVPGIMVWCASAVAVPALVEERRGVFGAIRRSWELTRGSRWHIFLLGILFWVFSMIVGGVAGAVSGTTMLSLTPGTMPDPLVLGFANGIASSLTNVVSTVIIAALYVELREVKEGAATDILADVFA